MRTRAATSREFLPSDGAPKRGPQPSAGERPWDSALIPPSHRPWASFGSPAWECDVALRARQCWQMRIYRAELALMTAARSQARWHRVSDCGRPGAGKGVHAWLCASASWCVCERAVPGPSAVARALSSLQSSPSVSVNDQATTWQGGGGGATAGFAPRPAASPCSCGHHSTTRRHAPSAHVHGNVANISVGIQRRRLKKWTELATQLCSPPVVSRSSALSASKRATGPSLLHRCRR